MLDDVIDAIGFGASHWAGRRLLSLDSVAARSDCDSEMHEYR